MSPNEIITRTQIKEAQLLHRKNVIAIAIGIIVITGYNLTLGLNTISETSTVDHLDGTTTSLSEIKRAIVNTLLIYIPVLGFILGALVSLIPYKDKAYISKYLLFSLLTILAIQIVIAVVKLFYW